MSTSIVENMLKYANFHSLRKNNPTTIAGMRKCNRICIINSFCLFCLSPNNQYTVLVHYKSIHPKAQLQHIQTLNARQYAVKHDTLGCLPWYTGNNFDILPASQNRSQPAFMRYRVDSYNFHLSYRLVFNKRQAIIMKEILLHGFHPSLRYHNVHTFECTEIRVSHVVYSSYFLGCRVLWGSEGCNRISKLMGQEFTL